MRPLTIELHYFGPYEHQVIDFTQFTEHSLFLVAGNTGAGKTTIFDAMCYALFGQTTNDRDRSAAALRSDFAPADQETMVKFTFEHQDLKYQIMRRPKQVLKGRRGNLVEHNQAVDLIYPLESDHPHEITKIKEADTFITDLLNLTRDQFKQIVLLPQGKFRQFLDSDSNTKEALLRDLFNTSRYEQWATQLKNDLREQKKSLTAQETKLQSLKETVTAIDPNHPLSSDLVYGEWNFGTEFVVGASQEGGKDTGLALKVSELQAEPATWRLVDTSTKAADMKRGELAMSLAPETAISNASAIDLSTASAPIDITERGWFLAAPQLGEDGTVSDEEATTLGVTAKAQMAGGNVNDSGCTSVVKVTYTMTPAFGIADGETNTVTGDGVTSNR